MAKSTGRTSQTLSATVPRQDRGSLLNKHSSKEPDWHYCCFILDTGCTDTLVSAKIEPFMDNPSPSDARIGGFAGSKITRGHLQGELHGYAIALRPTDSGTNISFPATTVTSLNMNLFSVSALFSQDGYSVIMRNPTRDDGQCEISRKDPITGRVTSIPVQYDYERKAFLVRMVISKSPKLAAKYGRIVEQHLQSRFGQNVARARASAISISDVAHAARIIHRNYGATTTCRGLLKDITSRIPPVCPTAVTDTNISTPPVCPSVGNGTMVRARAAPVIPGANTTARQDIGDSVVRDDNVSDPVLYKDMDSVITGTKDGLHSRERKLTILELHRRHGHIGHVPKCKICSMIRGSLRRVYAKSDHHVDSRPGHSFCMDIVTWSHVSRLGSRYTIVLRCMSCGFFYLIHLALRSDATKQLEEHILNLRANPLSSKLGFPIVQNIRCDPAGEWNEKCVKFNEMASRLGIHVEWSSPDSKRSNAHAENSILMIELVAKSILLESRLPAYFIEDAANQGAMLKNLYPMSRNQHSADGEAIRPLEQITGLQISRRMCNHRLHHLIPLGTPCFVYVPGVKGSNVDQMKVRWGIALKMIGDCPTFFCPFRGFQVQFRSKNYQEYRLPEGQSYYQFLGLPVPEMPRAAFQEQHPRDTNLRMIVQLQNYDQLPSAPRVNMPIEKILSRSESDKDNTPRVILVDKTGRIYSWSSEGVIQPTTKTVTIGHRSATSAVDAISSSLQPPVAIDITDAKDDQPPTMDSLLESDPHFFIGKTLFKAFPGHGTWLGTISSYDRKQKWWRITYPDSESEELDIHDMRKYMVRREDDPDSTATPASIPTAPFVLPSPVTLPPPTIQIVGPDASPSVQTPRCYITNDNDTFKSVCIGIGLPTDQHKLYYEWLGDEYGHTAQRIPDPTKPSLWFSNPWGGGRKSRFNAGQQFPIPADDRWKALIRARERDSNNSNANHVSDQYAKSLLAMVERCETFNTAHSRTQGPKQPRFILGQDLDGIHIRDILAENIRAHLATPSERSIIDPKTGKITAPTSIKDMMSRPDKDRWLKALNNELQTLDELGVFSHGHTMAEIRKLGITSSAVPSQMIFDVKFLPDGTLDRYKCREVICGHPGAMKRGVHYNATFAPSPSATTSRILLCLTIKHNYEMLCWDIKGAYRFADCRPHERIPVRYPHGMKRRHPKTGEELFAIMIKNCEGAPQGARRFSQLRDKFILKKFNEDGWSCVKSRMDPCLFIFTSPTKAKCFLLTYVDDCDSCGEKKEDLEYIANQFEIRFKIKKISSMFMLGVKREMKTVNGVRTIELTQPDFIETTYLQFREHLPPSPPTTPFPPHEFLHLADPDPDEKEHKEVIKLGYQRLCGCLLWAARNCYPEISSGVHHLCKLMSKPTRRAWKCGLHTLAYLHGQKHRGIKFRSDGSARGSALTCYYDSSNKPDPSDSKAQYGYVIFFMNGPIIWSCRKHNHIGMSSSHNEYMALSHAARCIYWLRQLVSEMGFEHLIAPPTPTLGDNDAATTLSREDLITPGNRFYVRDYHFVKECVESGCICTRRVSTHDNVADILTKNGARQDIERLRPLLTGYGELLPEPEEPPLD